MQKIKKGDKVKILAGKDSGRESTIERVLAKSGRVLVAGVNVYKRSISGKRAGVKEGAILDLVKSVDISNVVLVCPSCSETTRISFVVREGKRLRVCKKCQKEI